mmetsp:Transcript_31662/g.100946  ORF Transcript_31662/g.100946 Transcript_31662/m.100946 type:complete len:217 (+) Transcript_31662:479-1129(+)
MYATSSSAISVTHEWPALITSASFPLRRHSSYDARAASSWFPRTARNPRARDSATTSRDLGPLFTRSPTSTTVSSAVTAHFSRRSSSSSQHPWMSPMRITRPLLLTGSAAACSTGGSGSPRGVAVSWSNVDMTSELLFFFPFFLLPAWSAPKRAGAVRAPLSGCQKPLGAEGTAELTGRTPRLQAMGCDGVRLRVGGSKGMRVAKRRASLIIWCPR